MRRPRLRAAARLPILAMALLCVGGCDEPDRPDTPDTGQLGSDLLRSREPARREVPLSGSRGAEPLVSEAPRSEAPGGPGASEPGEGGRPSDPIQVDLAGLGHQAGDPDAPVRILEFSDFACGYCRQFHVDTWPTLQQQYVATGKVRWQYIPMILGIFGPNAENAAMAGECAMEQDRFPGVRDRLFAEQGSWKRADEPRAALREIARQEGLDVPRWEACMDASARVDRIAAGTALSRQLGVRGTPTFFVVGYGAIPGAIPLELFQQVLDTVWAEATAGGGP